MKSGFVDGVFCGIVITLIFAVAVFVHAAEPSAMQEPNGSDGDCCVRLGYMKAASVAAFNHSMHGDHKAAQEAGIDGLHRAGFKCATIPDPKDPRGKFLCE